MHVTYAELTPSVARLLYVVGLALIWPGFSPWSTPATEEMAMGESLRSAFSNATGT